MAGLTLSGDTLYGTAFEGGSGANGTVFSVDTNGGTFQSLYSFTRFAAAPPINSDGAKPFAQLVVPANVAYGCTTAGGPTGYGTAFGINTDGSAFEPFYSLTNIAGAVEGALALASNVLYGTTDGGGRFRNGTVFRIGIDGNGLGTLYSFSGGTDGAVPRAGLLINGNMLYGTTTAGGASGQGTVFKLNLDGTGFATLHSFTNGDGAPNRGTLALVGHNLFGITSYESAGLDGGTVYSLNTNGTGFTVLHNFTGGVDGGRPRGGLTASGTTLYGTTSIGGSIGNGTIFRLSLQPQLAIVPAGQNVILTWPTDYLGSDYSGFTLQSTADLFSGVWTTNLPDPVVINGQNVVTNPNSGTQQYFRLSQ